MKPKRWPRGPASQQPPECSGHLLQGPRPLAVAHACPQEGKPPTPPKKDFQIKPLRKTRNQGGFFKTSAAGSKCPCASGFLTGAVPVWRDSLIFSLVCRASSRACLWSPEMAPLLQAAGEVALDNSWTTTRTERVGGSAPPRPSQSGGPGAWAPPSVTPAAHRTRWTHRGVIPALQLTSPTSLLHLLLQAPRLSTGRAASRSSRFRTWLGAPSPRMEMPFPPSASWRILVAFNVPDDLGAAKSAVPAAGLLPGVNVVMLPAVLPGLWSA